MKNLTEMGARAAELLKARDEKLAVCETSAGGLVSAALLATHVARLAAQARERGDQ